MPCFSPFHQHRENDYMMRRIWELSGPSFLVVLVEISRNEEKASIIEVWDNNMS